MLSPRLTIALDADDPARPARFWAALLSREAQAQADGSVLLPGSDTQLGLRFTPGRGQPAGPTRSVHLHVTSDSPADQQHKVAAALELGGTHLDVGQRPDEGHIVLADPAGNPFCVTEPGNSYLAGTGLLGELACDGTRELGLFWSAALGWPLVWDQDGETAVQSPQGGTKIAWGGPPVDPKQAPNPQRLELTPIGADLDREADRLITLGAAPTGEKHLLTDPDGNEFRLVGSSSPV